MRWLLLVAAPVAGCAEAPLWADRVVSAPGAAPDERYGDPARAANGVRGGGCCQGSFDVYSLDPARGRGELVLEFSRPVSDGPGDDLAVYENPFDILSGGRFMDPTVVEVSSDGEIWAAFPHRYTAPDPEVWSSDPMHWEGFAGIVPVERHEEDAPLAGGGDRFDLQDLTDDDQERIDITWVSHVRLSPASTREDPATGRPFPTDPVSDGPDIDAVYSLAGEEPPG